MGSLKYDCFEIYPTGSRFALPSYYQVAYKVDLFAIHAVLAHRITYLHGTDMYRRKILKEVALSNSDTRWCLSKRVRPLCSMRNSCNTVFASTVVLLSKFTARANTLLM
jgi:hypothetical protein